MSLRSNQSRRQIFYFLSFSFSNMGIGCTKSVCLWILSLVIVIQTGSSLPYYATIRKERCFGELGCFSNQAPFNNTLGRLPRRFDVTFRLFTKKCRESSVIDIDSSMYQSTCELDPELPMKFVVHGFWQTAKNEWVSDTVTALLEKELMTIITVDWGTGAVHPYNQAAANTRVVAAKMSRLIKMLRIHPKKVHIIGYSMGAHIAGYVGENIRDIGRITGLDPAEPNFNKTESVVHLEKTDAAFVDIIHTDGTGWGWIKDVGHIDFYPNGGKSQPGCSVFDIAYSCSHGRSPQLFIESINTKYPFYGHPCESISDLDSNVGNCLTCSRGVCPEMGYNADKSFARGKFYLHTREKSPFSGSGWHVEVEFGNMKVVSGQIIVEMMDMKKVSTSLVIGSGSDYFRSGDRRHNFTVIRHYGDDVNELKVKYSQYKPWYYWLYNSDTYVVIYKIIVTRYVDGRSIHFCGDNVTIPDGKTATIGRSTTDPNECLLMPKEQHKYSKQSAANEMVTPLESSTMFMKFNPRHLAMETKTRLTKMEETVQEENTTNARITKTE